MDQTPTNLPSPSPPVSPSVSPPSTPPPSSPSNQSSPQSPLDRISEFIKNVRYWFNHHPKIVIPAFTVAIILMGVSLYVYFHTPSFTYFKTITTKIKTSLTSQQTSQSEGFVKLTIPEREPPFFILTPQTSSRFGILPEQKFTLKTAAVFEAQALQNLLNTSAPVRVTAVSPTEFILTPASAIPPNTPLRIALKTKNLTENGHTFDRNYSWAYQTQGDFRVVGSIPGNQKAGVPVNTGIELKFSQDDYQDPSKLISIEPAINYRLERHAETLAIVPIEPLAYQTVYTITLKPGLDITSRHDPIQEAYTFSFQTQAPQQDTPQPYLSLTDTFVQVTPRDQVQVKVYASHLDNAPIKTTWYQFNNLTDFLTSRKQIDELSTSWIAYYADTDPVDTSHLNAKGSADITLKTQPGEYDYFNVDYVELPEALPEGYYLVQFHYGDNHLEQLWVQSTFISSFAQVGRRDTLIWANTLDPSVHLEQATASVFGTSTTYPFNDQGLVSFSTPQSLLTDTGRYLVIQSLDNRQLAVPANAAIYAPETTKTANDYWSYLYQERRLYKSDDTVYFWGVIKDRDTAAPPGNVSVAINTGYSNNLTQHLNVTVTPQADGSFMGSLKLPNVTTGWYQLTLKVGDLNITNSGFEVTDYTKPDIKIEVESPLKAIFAGDSVTYQIKASFFDGTPANNLDLHVAGSVGNISGTVTTDAQGQAAYTYQSAYDANNTYPGYPRYESITVSPASATDSIIEGNGSVYVYGPHLSLKTTSHQDNAQANLEGLVNQIDLTGLNQGTATNVTGQPASNVKVNLSLTRMWWERQESGTDYDYIEKVTRKKYSYVEHRDTVYQGDQTTTATGQFTYQFTMDKGRSYQLDIALTDAEGHVIKKQAYFYYYQDKNPNAQDVAQPATLTLNAETNSFSVGDTASFTIQKDGQTYPVSDTTKFLYTIVTRGAQTSTVSNLPEYAFTFAQAHIPNAAVSAIVFNGHHYESINSACEWQWYCYQDYGYGDTAGYFPFTGITVQYNQTDSQLDVAIQPERSQYQPGDDVQINVTVSKAGQPIAGAHVNLVLVDQALAAIGGVREPSILKSLYAHVPPDILYRYYTHRPLFPNEPQAEKGGGGGDRELFKDTPFFGTQVTNDQGVATFNFTLPDNLTTWLIYAQGVTQNLDAGQAQNSLPVSLDFFVTSHFPKEVLVQDKPTLTAASYGRSLQSNQSINYETIFTDAHDQSVNTSSQSAPAFTQLVFPFPLLTPGTYKATLRGTFNSHTDGVTYPFTVVDTRLTNIYSAETYHLDPAQPLTILKAAFITSQPIRLTISDTGKNTYLYRLLQLESCTSNRLEVKVASRRAAALLSNYFDLSGCTADQTNLASFQDDDGGLGQVRWGGSDVATTVWTLLVNTDNFDQASLKRYLIAKLNQDNAGTLQQIYAAWGLSLIGDPQLVRLQALESQATTFEEKIILGLAYATTDNLEAARDLYYDILADYAYTKDPYIRLQPPTKAKNDDQYTQNSGWTLLLSSYVDTRYNSGLYRYVADYGNRASDLVTNLAEIAFIESELKKTPPQKTVVTFKTNSGSQTIDLSKQSVYSKSVSPSEFKSFTLSLLSGQADASFRYSIPSDQIGQLNQDDRLTLSRHYTKVKGSSDIKPGDIITITLNYTVDQDMSPKGAYSVVDYLPSGLAYLPNPSQYGLKSTGYVTQTAPQVIRTTFYNSDWWQRYGQKQTTYYTVALAPGEYVSEPAYIQSGTDYAVFRSTPADKVTIGNP